MKPKFLLALCAITILAAYGCAASIDPVSFTGPDGKTAYAMKCSGFGRTRIACLQKAGELCPAGYTIVDDSSQVVGEPINGGTVIGTQNQLAISCR